MKSLKQKAEGFDDSIKQRHLFEGLVVPTIVLPPRGREDYQTGNYENSAIWTGLYVASKAFEYAVTGLEGVRRDAKESLLALHKLQDVTERKGTIARGFKIAQEPSWDEDLFWNGRTEKNPWYQKGDYRVLGDSSKSQVFGIAFGYFAFNKFCNPSIDERKEMGDKFSAIVGSIQDSGGRLIDIDCEPTKYGNYSPKQYFGLGGIGPFLMLSHLRLAYELTGKEKFEKDFWDLLERDNYFKFLERCRVNLPFLKKRSTSFGSEDNLAMLNYYMLMNLEDDSEVQRSCKKGLEKRWKVIDNPGNSLFNFVYHSLTDRFCTPIKRGIDSLRGFSEEKRVGGVALKRKFKGVSKKIKSIENWAVDEYAWRINPLRNDFWVPGAGEMEFSGVDFNLAYWFGRMIGFISAEQ